MYDDFIKFFSSQLIQKGYAIELPPVIPGVRGLLSANSKQLTSVGPIKFFNHYLFVDWENDHFGRIDALLETQKKFRTFVNKDYKIPNGWRLKIPNLVVAALSKSQFNDKAIEYVQNNYQIPWQGGEVGQMMLFDLQNREIFCHYRKTYKQTGSIPLGYAVDELFSFFKNILPDAKCIMQRTKSSATDLS